MIDKPINVNDIEFEEKVLNSDLPVIVDFWAVWCAPCKITGPMLDRIAKENSGKLIVAKVDVDANSEWATRYGIQGIPTMLFIYNKKIAYRQTGALPEKVLKQIVEEFLYTIEGNYTFRNSPPA